MVRKITVRGMNVGAIPVGAASRRDYFKLCKTDKAAPRQLLLRGSTSCIPAVVRSLRPRYTVHTPGHPLDQYLVSPCPEHNRDRLRRSLPQSGDTAEAEAQVTPQKQKPR